jgi:ABC-2 type transport system permease protein
LIPDTFKSFTPVDFEWVISYAGRIAFNLDEPMLIAIVALWAIARGSDVVSGELSRGTMEMLLAQPVTRRAVFVNQSVVTLAGLLLIVLAAWLGMWLGVQICSVTETPVRSPWQTLTEPIWARLRDEFGFLFAAIGYKEAAEVTREVPLRDVVNCWIFWPGLVNFFSFGFFLSGLAALFSAWDRHRWRTIGIVTGIYTAMALFKLVGMSLKNGAIFLWFTFFTFYEPEQAIEIYQRSPQSLWSWAAVNQQGEFASLGPMTNNLILLGLGIGCYWWGVRVFSRRDLPAPV